MRDFYYVDSGGILCYPDGRIMSPADAASKINKLVSENRRYKDRLQIDPGGSDKIDELHQSTDFLKHNLEMAEKQIEQWKDASGLERGGDPPEATGEYVDVMGEMTIPFTVQLPVEFCREPVACDDPAIEAALQAVAGHINTYIWGEDKKPAVVYCDLNEQNVEIESDDRKHLKKDSTRLTDEAVNSGSCNDGELGEKCDQS